MSRPTPEDLKRAINQAEAPKPRDYPSGWTPGISMDGEVGTLVTRPSANKSPSWEDELRSWGFDPAVYTVIEPVQYRTWEMYAGGEIQQLHYYKANIITRPQGVLTITADDLMAKIGRWRKPKATPPPGEHAFVFCVADTQLGGPGHAKIADRWLDAIGQAQDRVRDLRRTGVQIGEIWIVGLGDIVENCDGFYPAQAFQVELNMRDQIKVGFRLLINTGRDLLNLAERSGMTAVAGNHGENRRKGAYYTDTGDNFDLLAFEIAYDALTQNQDAFGHVVASFPDKDLTHSLMIGGLPVGLAHGHQARRGVGSAKKVENWWKDQTFGGRKVADVDLLLTGHYHTLLVQELGHLTHIQCPTADEGSPWFEETAGQGSRPGFLTFTTSPAGPDNLKVLGR